MNYLQLLITSLLLIILYLPVIPPLVKEWMTVQDSSHGFLVPLISLYFLWHKRADLKKTPISPSPAGIVIIAAGILLYMAATVGYQFFLQCASILVVIYGLVYANAGSRIAKKMAFAISYLIFMIPLPDLVYTTITFHLRLFSTKAAFFIMTLLGMNATRDGNIINLPTCALTVANPCSGLRGLVVFMAASLAIGYIFQESIIKRAILFMSAVILAIILNIVRLVITGLSVDILELNHIPEAIHDATGYVVLIAGFVILFGINDLLKKAK